MAEQLTSQEVFGFLRTDGSLYEGLRPSEDQK